MLTRRAFVAASSLTLSHRGWLLAQAPAPTTRPNIAEIDRVRILAAAEEAIKNPPTPSRDFASDGWLEFTLNLPALAAAAFIDPAHAGDYTVAAAAQLETWILNPKTKPVIEIPEVERLSETRPDPTPLLALAPLAETIVGLPFLQLQPALVARLKRSFAAYLKFLTEDPTALLARDSKDHNQSSWLLQVAALAQFTGNEAALTDARHRFHIQVIRAQINATGEFPHEITGDYPYRDSLWNLDLLAGACMLLSTRFESVWDYELQDGPGMRGAIAYHVPYIARRVSWPHQADLDHFNQLPCRRPALVFAGRAYAEAEYVSLWRTLEPQPADKGLLRTFPIRQPVLWLPQPKARV
jgi:hypothetical protein